MEYFIIRTLVDLNFESPSEESPIEPSVCKLSLSMIVLRAVSTLGVHVVQKNINLGEGSVHSSSLISAYLLCSQPLHHWH